MELTLESALSSEGALGHAAYLLLVMSMLMRRMFWLRVLVIASALVAISYAVLILTDPVSTFWETLLILVNIGQLTLSWWLDRRTQFEPHEDRLRRLHFPSLAPSKLRRLLHKGEWRHLPAGTSLTSVGAPVPALYFLESGVAQVVVDAIPVATCNGGEFIGEMTVLQAEPAYADVEMSKAGMVWQIDAAQLRAIAARSPETLNALEAAFFRTMRTRLAASNAQRRAEAVGA